jgi:hypothetical protein
LNLVEDHVVSEFDPVDIRAVSVHALVQKLPAADRFAAVSRRGRYSTRRQDLNGRPLGVRVDIRRVGGHAGTFV